MKGLIIIEHDNQNLKPVNLHTLSAATQLAEEIDLLIAGYQCDPVVQAAKQLPRINKIFHADAVEYAHGIAENTAPLIAAHAKHYQYIFMGATTFGKNILPRAAALLDCGVIADVIKIISKDRFQRPIFAGNAISEVQSLDEIKFLTIRSTAFSPVQGDVKVIPVEKMNVVPTKSPTTFISQELTKSPRPELTASRIVIAGGRGLKSAENFKLLESLADRLGAAVGASRAAVDAGFAPNDYQVGQTGKVVAPDLYIAVGISGAIQHLAGMKDSKVIVAINNDPDAPIFEIADYGWVTDLFSAIKQLNEELAKN